MDGDERIWRLRDAAIRVLHGCGYWQRLGGLRLLTADWRDLKIVYRTPFQRKRPDPLTYATALAVAEAEPDLAYVLEIWQCRGTQWSQVLHMQWSEDNAEQRVLSHRSGEWELSLIVLVPS